MFKRILVPTDGSDITAHAADTAIQLAKLHGAQLLTLSVMEPFPYAAVSEIQPVPPQEFIDAHQAHPKPFVWAKSADEILASIARFAQRTVDAHAAPHVSRTTVTGH